MQSGYHIYIKGMVCERCILTVRQELNALNIPVADIKLGEVTTLTALTAPDISAIEQRLKPLGFAILEDKKTKLVREVKQLVEQVYSGQYDFPTNFRFSNAVQDFFNKDYDSVSAIFSQLDNITLETYIIGFRIEKVKEFLVYSDDRLADIAFKLGFSSTSHVSRQFKMETGLSTSHFRKIRNNKGVVIDKAGRDL